MNIDQELKYNDEVYFNILHMIEQQGIIDKLTNNEIVEIKKYVDSEFQIYQPEGVVLLDDYEHEQNWYTKVKDNIKSFYWDRYRKYLFNNGWPIEVLNQLDFKTLDQLMNYLGDPKFEGQFSRRGLVMGDVQSGKTSNYIGLIAKAVDAGYKVIILLTGVLENLRRQTQIRVEEGFIGYDVENRRRVGVGEKDNLGIIPKSATSRINDFTGTAGENTFSHFENDNTPHIFITKKNSKTLKKIRDTISNINIVPPHNKVDTSLLIIDDEADNASVNTNKPENDPTKINAEIRKLLNIFTKSNYVGFTATPFANVFIDPDSQTEMLENDLFPRDFIYSLNSPSNYYGPNEIFMNKSSDFVQIIDDSNTDFPLNHDKNWNENILFDSLIEAINSFLLINAIRDIREKSVKNSHRSMLINVSRFIKVQEKIEILVNNKVENITNSIRQSQKLNFDSYIKNNYISSIYETYKKHFINTCSWEEIFSVLYEAIKDIRIFKVPTKDKEKQLNYEKHEEHGLRAIVIGGLALSRGLTLEGLTISYLYRNTSTFDVLMQMGRWFGYRNKPREYGDLCKIWMLEQTRQYFKEITFSINELRQDLITLSLSQKTPKEFGIRVRNESEKLGITNRNKMRTSKKYVFASDLFGQVLETPFISSNEESIKINIKLVNSLVANNIFSRVDGNLLAKDINKSILMSFLREVIIHEANRITYFQKEEIIKFINDFKLEKFDIVIISGNANVVDFGKFNIKPLERSFDLLDENTIRIGGTHRKLGGPSDTKYGLEQVEIEMVKNKFEKISNTSYMIESRNPLLIIYPISLKQIKNDDDMKKLSLEEVHNINKLVEKLISQNLYPIGFAIGFPSDKVRGNTQKKVFYINDRTKWWNLMNRKDSEEDE
jgi:hypothetical protein